MESEREPRTGHRGATKKARIIEMHDQGFDVEQIADALTTNASYVANTLIEAGHTVDYDDLYTTTTGRAYSAEARRLSGILKFRDVVAAKESVRRLEEVYHQFEMEGNRRGQHRAQMLALIGKNRAQGIGKREEAAVFREWLESTLHRESEAEDRRAA